MKEEFENIINEFKKINKLGYVKGISNNTNAAGLTLEKLLNKKPDTLFFPDYEDIEVKCTQRFSRYNIRLFKLTFDGPYLFESHYLLETYGEYDNVYKNYKKLNVNLKINEKVLIYNKYYFELKIDNEKIYIKIYDKNKNFIEDRAFIYLNSIKKRLELKLNKLALFYASKKNIDDNLYFRYYKLECYKYKNMSAFIDCLNKGTVQISLILRFSRNQNSLGKNRSNNFLFSINKLKLQELFNKIHEENDN